MPLTVVCHSCGGRFAAPDNAAGKSANCPKCGARIEIRCLEKISDAELHQLFEIAQQADSRYSSRKQFGSGSARTATRTKDSHDTWRKGVWQRIPVGAVVGAALGLFVSYWCQPGVYRAFVPFGSYLFDCPRLVLHLFAISPDGAISRTMALLIVVGGIAGFALSYRVPSLRRTLKNEDVIAVTGIARRYAARYRYPHIVRSLLPLLLPILLACAVLGVGIVLLKSLAPATMRKATAIAKPAWYGAILDCVEKHERVLSVDRVYKPESLDGAMVYGDGFWCDARGEYSFTAFAPYGPGKGECNSACKFGVRWEYQIDEGFGRTGNEDCVFFLTSDYKVIGYLPTEMIRFGRVRSIDAQQHDAVKFLSGQAADGLSTPQLPIPPNPGAD